MQEEKGQEVVEEMFDDSIISNTENSLDINVITKYGQELMDWAVVFIPKVLIALFILWMGFKIATKVGSLIKMGLEKASLGIEVTEFLSSMINTILKVVVIGLAASVVGIKMTALIGLLGAAVFAIGMALQGFMGNFASGLTILFLKPYKVGDWISVEESFGKVKTIQIFNTTLETPNDKTLIIPNGQVTDNVITNFSSMGNIRLELNVSMPYAESFPKVKKVIKEALSKSQYVIQDLEALIGIETYDSHNIILAIRPYIKPDNYWNATFEIYGLVKNEFNKNNIKAAYSEGVELGPIGD